MNVHIYDTKIKPGSVIMITGNVNPDDKASFFGWVNAVREAAPGHPILFVPENLTVDIEESEDIVSLLKDAFTVYDLEALCKLSGDAYSRKMSESYAPDTHEEEPEEEEHDEV